MSDIPQPNQKKSWPDGIERVCDGSNIRFGNGPFCFTSVCETPREVRALIREATKKNPWVELHHHADFEVTVYMHRKCFRVIDPRWRKVNHDA